MRLVMISIHSNLDRHLGYEPTMPEQGEPAGSSVASGADISDSHLAILYLNNANRSLERAGARHDVHSAAERIRDAREGARAAHEEARKKEDESSFWGSVAGTAAAIGTVAAAAATIAATGGAGAVIVAAGVATKAGALLAKETGVIDEKTASWVDTAGSLTMAAGGVTSALIPADAAVSALSTAVETGGQVVNVGAEAVETGASYGSQSYLAAGQEGRARAERHKAETSQAEGGRDIAMANYRKAVESRHKESEIVVQTAASNHHAALSLIANVRG